MFRLILLFSLYILINSYYLKKYVEDDDLYAADGSEMTFDVCIFPEIVNWNITSDCIFPDNCNINSDDGLINTTECDSENKCVIFYSKLFERTGTCIDYNRCIYNKKSKVGCD